MNGKRHSLPGMGKLAVLDVGHGASAVVIYKGGTIVIDTGRGSSLLEYLTENKVQKIETVILTHADQDHIGAMAALLSSGLFQIGEVYLNTDSEKNSTTWDDLLYELNEAQNAGRINFKTSLARGQNGTLSLGILLIEILAPSSYLAAKGPGSMDSRGKKITANTISAVLRLCIGKKPVAIIAGDLDTLGLNYLLKYKINTKAPILVFPHHGGRPGTSSARRFAKRIYKAVSPKVVIFSTGRGKYGTPSPEIIRELSPRMRHCWIACTQLSIECAETLPDNQPPHLAAVFAQGKEHRKCCIGTVLIDLNHPIVISPTRKDHYLFVKKYAPNALCFRCR